jgi:uncharacterized phage-associated protein
MGPVPASYSNLYDKLCEEGLVEINQVSFDDGKIYGDVIVGLSPDTNGLLAKEELDVLAQVSAKLGTLKTSSIIEMCHQEKAWIENRESKELISYSKYAFDLKNFD